MAEEIVMPRLSDTMQEGTIARWVKHEGEPVKTGDVLMEVETDKATLELNSYYDGTLAKILIGDGGTAPVGTVVGILTRPGEDLPAEYAGGGSNGAAAATAPPEPATPPETAPATTPAATAAPEASAPVPPAPQAAPPTDQPPAATPSASASIERQDLPSADEVKASPLARTMAEEAGVDLRLVAGKGSGPGGRVVRADVEALIREGREGKDGRESKESQPAPPLLSQGAAPTPALASAQTSAVAGADESVADYEDEPLSRMRAGIARNIGISKPGIPHIYLTVDVETDALLALRKSLNDAVGQDQRGRISVNDLVIKAAALALRKFPALNAWFVEGQPPKIRTFRRVHIGVAVSVEGGLVVPVIRDADSKSLGTVAREAKDIYDRVKANKPRPDEYTGGTFTVSNLGAWGIEEFQAVINPPQAGILAVGAAAPRAVVRDGAVVIRNVMRVTLSSDHRVADGVYGAEYLQELKRLVESPLNLVM